MENKIIIMNRKRARKPVILWNVCLMRWRKRDVDADVLSMSGEGEGLRGKGGRNRETYHIEITDFANAPNEYIYIDLTCITCFVMVGYFVGFCLFMLFELFCNCLIIY